MKFRISIRILEMLGCDFLVFFIDILLLMLGKYRFFSILLLPNFSHGLKFKNLNGFGFYRQMVQK